MYVICKVTLPALLILRLADSNSPGMDKLLFYVHQFRASLEAHGEMLDDEELFPPDDKFEVDEQLAKDTFDMPDGGEMKRRKTMILQEILTLTRMMMRPQTHHPV